MTFNLKQRNVASDIFFPPHKHTAKLQFYKKAEGSSPILDQSLFFTVTSHHFITNMVGSSGPENISGKYLNNFVTLCLNFITNISIW